ncbi:MAG: hypothetical protein ACRDMZ_20560 [Solirubrobacteraceae bacterium]
MPAVAVAATAAVLAVVIVPLLGTGLRPVRVRAIGLDVAGELVAHELDRRRRNDGN